MIKRYFPGANTPKGYVSLFENIISWSDADRIFIIKGGPGVGKSTLMKKLAKSLHKENVNLELLYCTSDSNSLDGLILTDYKISVLDGTAPHILEPKYPGCVDEIINLGIFWDEDEVKKYKKEIIYLNNKISAIYRSAYRYLQAAKTIDDDLKDIYTSATNFNQTRIILQKIKDSIFSNYKSKNIKPQIRQMFASAITADGYIDYVDSLFNNIENRYIIKGPNSKCKSIIFKNIFTTAQEIGFDVDIFKNPMNPLEIEHILIPELNTVVITLTSNESNMIKDNDKIVDLNLSMQINESQQKIVDYNIKMYKELLNRSIKLLNKTKSIHNELESIYSASMKFDYVNNIASNILKKIKKHMRNF